MCRLTTHWYAEETATTKGKNCKTLFLPFLYLVLWWPERGAGNKWKNEKKILRQGWCWLEPPFLSFLLMSFHFF